MVTGGSRHRRDSARARHAEGVKVAITGLRVAAGGSAKLERLAPNGVETETGRRPPVRGSGRAVTSAVRRFGGLDIS